VAAAVSYVWATPYRTRKKMEIVTQSGRRLVVPIGPETTQGGFSIDQQSSPRVGIKPVTWVAGQQLRTFSWTMTVTGRSGGAQHIDPSVSIEPFLHTLRDFARKGEKVMLTNYGPSMVGWFNIIDCRIVARRRNLNNDITVAEIEMELREAVSPRSFVGPISGGAFIVAARATSAEAGGALPLAAPLASGGGGGITGGSSSDRDTPWVPPPGGYSGSTGGSVAPGPTPYSGSTGGSVMPGSTPGDVQVGTRTTMYVTRSGDSWTSIAIKYYGSDRYRHVLADFNGYADTGNPRVGTLVQLPPKATLDYLLRPR
jgi:hypothetical protein